MTTGSWAATLLTLALLSPLAGVAYGSGNPAPTSYRIAPSPTRGDNATCEARYARAVSELRRGMVTGCLHSLDDAVVRCDPSSAPHASASDAAIGARASFLRARVLLLDGDWAAAEEAATAAREWSAHRALLDPDATHHHRALDAADAIIAKAKRVRFLHDAAVGAAREFRHERAFWTAGEALRTSWRSYDLLVVRAKAGVELDLYASVRQDVARALKIRPKSPDALRTLAEALRRCVRTTNALKASAGVLRDCLRANPDDGGCRRQLRRDQSLLTLINDAASAEREGDYDAAMASLVDFGRKDVRRLFRAGTDAALCRVSSLAARTKRAARAARGRGRKGGAEGGADEDEWGFIERLRFGFGSRGGSAENGGEEDDDDEWGDAAAERAVGWCQSAIPALEAVVEKNGAGDGGHDATELARAYANRGWARLLRGTVDAADADLAAARRALEDFSLLRENVDEDLDDDDFEDDDEDDVEVGSSPSSSSSSSSYGGEVSGYVKRSGSNDSQTKEGSVDADLADLARAVAAAREALKPRDLYAVLGLTRADADRPDWRTVLKRAYRALALLFHPDKNPRDPEAAGARFLEISEAYKTLADDAARARYDGTGVAGVQPETEGHERWGAERPTKPDADGFGARERGPPGGAPEDWKFQFDKRDVDADGFARGRWVHKETGESADGTRDVSPARRKNPCERRHACVDGAGGVPAAGTPRGRIRDVPTAVTDASSPRNSARARLVVNHLGFQTLELGFTLAHESVPGPGGATSTSRVPGGADHHPPDGRRRLGDPLRLLVRERLRALVAAVAAALTPGEGTPGGGEGKNERLSPSSAAWVADKADLASGGAERQISDVLRRVIHGASRGAYADRDRAEATRAMRRFASAAALQLARIGALGLDAGRGARGASSSADSDGRDSSFGENSDGRFGELSAAQTTAAELCDNPTVAARTLATPSEAEMAAAREGASTGSDGSFDAGGWAYVVWGKADRARVQRRVQRRPWNGGHDGRVRGGGWAGDRSEEGDEDGDEDEDEDEEDEEYVVRPGDSVWYEVKWRGAEAVDLNDPVAGSNPTRAAHAGDHEDHEDADGWNASGGSASGGSATDDLWTSPDDLLSDDFADGSAPAHVALDVECEDGTRLSRTDALDDRGLYANPRVDLRGATRRFGESGWLHRRVAFPREFWGKKLARWGAGCEGVAPGTRTRASVRNVRVVGADGREVFAALPSHGRPRVISDGDES